MTEAQTARVTALLAGARTQSAGGRAEWLQQACPDDEEVRSEVYRLLAATPAAALPAEADLRPEDFLGREVGTYRLEAVLGAGGFGVVYRAEQTRPLRRTVALKLIRPGMDSQSVLARFALERQALAVLDHANIARVFDAGATPDGRPYFVMEYVPGIPIREYADQNCLSTPDRLRLFMAVCQAVQHAHQKGIIHRDLKPSNVLVAVEDSRPVPKVIDFGIAKATSQRLSGEASLTQQGQFVGTPAYMSPEQAESDLDVDTRADVYSLGVMLYELLTGVLPFDPELLRAASPAEFHQVVREVEAVRPSVRLRGLLSARPSSPGDTPVHSRRVLPTAVRRLNAWSRAAPRLAEIADARRTEPRTLIRQLRGDLDWIVLKALEKDRGRRYPSASEFAADIQRHLQHEPVTARAPSVRYRLSKFARRRRGVLAAAGLAGVLMAAGTVVSLDQARRATAAEVAEGQARRTAEARAELARKEAEKARAVAELLENMFLAADPHIPKTVDYTVQQLLDDFALEQLEELRGQPEIESELRSIVGNAYRGLGRIAQAETQIRAAGELLLRLHPGDHEDRVRNLADLAWIRHDQEDYVAAERAFLEALAMQIRLTGLRDERAANLHSALGDLYRHQHKFTHAEEELQQAIAIHESLSDDPAAIRTARLHLVLLWQQQGRLHEALRECQALLEAQLEEEEPDEDDTAQLLEILGRLEHELHQYGDAEESFRLAAELQEELRGPNHPETLGLREALERSIRAQGRVADAEACRIERLRHLPPDSVRLEEARARRDGGDRAGAVALYREAVQLSRQRLAKDDPALAQRLIEFAALLRDEPGPEPEELLRSAVTILEQAYGPADARIVSALYELAGLLKRRHEYAAAEALYLRGLEVRRRCYGDVHPEVMWSLYLLGYVRVDNRDWPAAEQAFREAMDIERQLSGDEYHVLENARGWLRRILTAQGKHAELEALYRTYVERQRHLQDGLHDGLARMLRELATVLLSQGRADAALPELEEALTIRRRLHGDGHAAVIEARGWLASALVQQQRFAEAEALLLQAVGDFQGSPEASAGAVRPVLELLVRCYTLWDAAEPGAGHANRAGPWRDRLAVLDAAAAATTAPASQE